jgi:hypothetical protein
LAAEARVDETAVEEALPLRHPHQSENWLAQHFATILANRLARFLICSTVKDLVTLLECVAANLPAALRAG